MIGAGLSRLLADPRRRVAALGVASIAILLLALAPGDLAPAAARGAAVALVLAVAAVLLRRRAGPAPDATSLRVVAARALARDAGVALVEVNGRRVLVGFGTAGVRLLSEMGDASDEDGP